MCRLTWEEPRRLPGGRATTTPTDSSWTPSFSSHLPFPPKCTLVSIHCKQEVRLSTGARRIFLVCTVAGDRALKSQPAGLQSHWEMAQPATCSHWWVDQLTNTNKREKRPSQEWREVPVGRGNNTDVVMKESPGPLAPPRHRCSWLALESIAEMHSIIGRVY